MRTIVGHLTDVALRAVYAERVRQCELRDAGRFAYTPADPGMTDAQRLASVVEEIGEVARAMQEADGSVNDKHGGNVRKELVQVAALCVAWVERLDTLAAARAIGQEAAAIGEAMARRASGITYTGTEYTGDGFTFTPVNFDAHGRTDATGHCTAVNEYLLDADDCPPVVRATTLGVGDRVEVTTDQGARIGRVVGLDWHAVDVGGVVLAIEPGKVRAA